MATETIGRHRVPDEEINGMSIEILARTLYDVRSKRRNECTDEEWERHAVQFPTTHRMLMEAARREARRD